MIGSSNRLHLAILMALNFAVRANGDDLPKAAENKPDAREAISWPTGLDAAKRRALNENRPLLVRVGASWCGPCHKLDEEIAKPEVQDELKRWAIVYVDSDNSPDEVARLDVGPIPALRVIDQRGKVVAANDGYLPADELLTWLKKGFDRGAEGADPLLTAEGPPDAEAVGKLVGMLQQQDSVPREAAIRRLLPYPKASAEKSVEAFSRGKLATRLAVLELLHEWKAPSDGLDPWRPETLTAERQAALKKWAASAATKMDRPAQLDPLKADAARSDLIRLGQLPDAEAEALAERLVRLGPALAPLVAAQLKEATTDRAHERLLALRYRLVTTNALALSWPGGLARLAATDVNVRHKAAEDLVARATQADLPLLSELFTDPDPLVREISLRGLLSVGGNGANGMLVKLLDDPDLNVRAAVLKQLAEHPTPQLVGPIANYVAGEKDPDLLVHAIRFLKEVPAAATVECLQKLLAHESWQVRAEAAEALGKSTRNAQPGLQADIYAALIKLLDDPDPFVISRAIEGLGDDLPAAVDPLVHVIATRPDLAQQAVTALIRGEKMKIKAIPALKKLTGDKEPAIRAAAVTGLGTAAPADCEHEVLAAVRDSASGVRRAGAEVLWQLFEAARPERARDEFRVTPALETSDGARAPMQTSLTDFLLEIALRQIDPNESWLLAYRQGQDRAEWLASAAEPLEKMLAAESADERLAAALALLPLGRDEAALPVLKRLAQNQPGRRVGVAAALPWLPPAKRVALFNDLVALKPGAPALGQIAEAMGQMKGRVSTDALWGLLADVDRLPDGAVLKSVVYRVLTGHYRAVEEGTTIGDPFGAPRHELLASAEDSLPWSHLSELKSRAASGSWAQRSVALALLLSVEPAAAPDLATKLIAEANSDAVRREAFRFLLLAQPEAQGEKAAVGQAIGKDAPLRRLAITYLAQGRGALQSMKDEPLDIYDIRGFNRYSQPDNAGQPIEVTPPAGLSAEAVRPLLKDADREVSAAAGYLLATLGESDGLDALIKHWRAHGNEDTSWTRLVYRAITALNDAKRVPVLDEIYKHRESIDMKDFYWTIRGMKGAEILELRKRIRDEVGLQNLR